MARVFRARDMRLDRDVAVKVLSPPYADDPAFSRRFLAEARAAASISHPSLVHVYDSGSDGAAHFMVMELLDRHRSLRQEVDARGPLPRDEVLRIGRELLAGLKVVHDRGLMHCDVKSGNVMLGPGVAKLIDFGIARPPNEALEGNTSIGSLQFMSPEQLHGEALTPASDLFSLGVVLYEALTARLPYAGVTPAEVSAAHRSATVPAPSVLAAGIPGRLDDAILQALRPEPGSRFRSAAAMERALEAADDDARAEAGARDDADETRVVAIPPRRDGGYIPPPIPARPPPQQRRERAPAPAPAPARGPRRRSRSWSLLGTILILGVAALVVVLVVLPIINSGGLVGASASPSPSASSVAPPGTVLVPATVGMSTADAIDAADEAGLNWTVRCDDDPAQPEGIISQEPPAGTAVAPGSRFTMFSARIDDCR